MKLKISIFCLFAIIHFYAFAEIRLENWKNHSSYLQATAVSVDSKYRIWAGTSGGAFMYDREKDEFTTFNNLNGLFAADVSALYCDKESKKIFIGTEEGVLTIVTEDLMWEHFLDIQSAKFPNAKINRFLKHNNLLFIAGGFGLAVFDLEKKVFKESIFRFGDFDKQSNVNDLIIENETIWAASSSGVACANINSTIANPYSWATYSTNQGLNDKEVIALALFNVEIYAGTKKAVFRFSKDTFLLEQKVEDWDEVKKLDEYKNELLITSQYFIKTLFDRTVYSPFAGIIDGSYIEQGRDTFLLANFRNQGVFYYKDELVKQLLPNGPYSNIFGDLSIAANGDLWAATSNSPRGRGFMRLSKGRWTNFFLDSFPELKSNDYYKIYCGIDNSVYASSWGAGFLKISSFGDSLAFENFSKNNSPLSSVASSPDYVITGEITHDKRGTLWVVNYGEVSSGPVLVALSEGKYHSFPNAISPSNRYFIPIAVDLSNTKWLGSDHNAGLLYFNEIENLENKSDDVSGQLTMSNSALPSNIVKCIEVDKSGYVWIGTENGLAVIYTPSTVLNNRTAVVRQNNLLGSIRVNDIMIDALDNKWIASNNGVWVLNSDCSELLHYINKSNSPIIDNNVISLASNPETGQIYFGTNSGLSEVFSISISPLPDFDISCYPQPFDPQFDGELTIDGLSEESQIRILTISGDFVKEITSYSRKAIWDGKDFRGNYVSSGVYVISASSASKGNAGIAKIAVIRK